MNKVNAMEMRTVEGGATYYTTCGLAYRDRYFLFFKTFNGKKARDAHQKLCPACNAGKKLY